MNVLPNYKDIIDLIKKGATLEAQEKIMELRVAALELQEDNLQLRTQVTKLQEEITTAKSLQFVDGLYWLAAPDKNKDGPFCPTCRDKDSKLVRLHDGRKHNYESRWCCLICQFSTDD